MIIVMTMIVAKMIIAKHYGSNNSIENDNDIKHPNDMIMIMVLSTMII